MTFGEYGNCIGRCTTRETLCTPENLYHAIHGQDEKDVADRLQLMKDQALNVVKMDEGEFMAWGAAEYAKYTADPDGYCSANIGPHFKVINAVELLAKEIEPARCIVDEILKVGLTFWASPPKYGKSWGALDLVLAVASGARFLGYRTYKCGTLYLALEDSERRLQERMEKVLNGRPAPEGTSFATSAFDLDNGLLAQLEEHVQKHPDTGLIVLDTFQKIRGAVHGRENPYSADYRECAALKSFADAHNLAILVIHHLRKMSDDSDPFNRISGTTGISGAADAMWVLCKDKRSAETATLYVTGRDVEQQELKVRFDKDTCRWQNLGDAEAYEAQVALENYERDPIVATVRKLLKQDPNGWEGSAQDLITAGRLLTGKTLASTPRELAEKLKGLDRWLFEVDKIDHQRKRNGSGGGKHLFTRVQGVAA